MLHGEEGSQRTKPGEISWKEEEVVGWRSGWQGRRRRGKERGGEERRQREKVRNKEKVVGGGGGGEKRGEWKDEPYINIIIHLQSFI